MSASKGIMRQVEEKYAMNEIYIIVWSNKIDLLTLSNSKGKMLSMDHITSWADETEAEKRGTRLPPPTVVLKNGLKIVTSYRRNENNKLEKIVRVYRIENRKVLKSVAARKLWKKFGDCTSDKSGPNPANTYLGEEVRMKFLSAKENNAPEDNVFDKLKPQKSFMKCRICSDSHWTLNCPFKNVKNWTKQEEKSSQIETIQDKNKNQKYIPPYLRDSAHKARTSEITHKTCDIPVIKIGNLSYSTTEQDLEQLVRWFGPISKFVLPKSNRNPSLNRGFAKIYFKSRTDAQAAILALNRHGYDNLILEVDWANSYKPSSKN